jgi:capsular exopolysaccharide synthesis family protein
MKDEQKSIADFEKITHSVSPREILLRYLPFLPWVLGSIFIFLSLAFLKLRYSPNIYNVKGTILISDPNAMGNQSGKIEEMLFATPNKNINDEIQVLRSRQMAKRVAKSLRLEIQYYVEGKIRTSQVSTAGSPFKLEILSLADSTLGFIFPVFVLNDREFSLVENGAKFFFNQPFESSLGRFLLRRTAVATSSFGSNKFVVDFASADTRANHLVNGLSAIPSGESDNILELTYTTENTEIGVAIVNQWMREYQQAGLEDKKQVAVNALKFIDEQMDAVKDELGGVEINLLGFREKNKIINPEQQAQNLFSGLTELENEITKQGVRVQVLDNLVGYISDNKNPYRQVGSTLGIEEPSLAIQIGEFNKLQVERETILRTTTRSNPMVINLETRLEKLRVDILQNLKNVRQAYQFSINDLNARNRVMGREVSKIPAKEKQLIDITRRQKILEELYSFLLQKKLETSIGSASTISNVRVIEPAVAPDGPVSPNRQSTYTIALFLGLLLPALIIFLLEYFNDKVQSREDIQKWTQAPIIGEVGHADEKAPLVVSQTSRKFIAEQFRIIRTNLQYILTKQDKAVILITSSTSGEGKSFISSNFGAVMALTGKKTAIVEFDIRKPRIMSAFNLPRGTGITNFIIGKSSFEDLAVPMPGFDNLFIIPCGPIPPNPAELLLDERLDLLMQKLKETYDVIVIDTAPVGLVSDAIALGKFADSSLYVVRHNYTYKKQLQLLNDIYANKRLPKISLVINDIKEGGYGKYYGYGGYGYAGYGYGSEYFEELKSKPVRLLDSIKNIFNKN